MSDTQLETISISGSRPPYKKPVWVIGQVGDEGKRRRAQTAPGTRQGKLSSRNRRPKSTPCNGLDVRFGNSPRTRCYRYGQVQSARRRNSLENSGEGGQECFSSPIILAPGYILSRSKEKIDVTIKTDDFFAEGRQVNTKQKTRPPDERDVALSHLQQQIDDLTLWLEEERFNHRTSSRKTAEEHKKHIEQIHEEHVKHIESIDEDHEDEMQKLKSMFEQQLETTKATADSDKAQLKRELEALQGAFEGYKETVATEMDYKWERRVREFQHESDQRMDKALMELRKELNQEKNKELDATHKEHQRQIQILVESNKKEIDRLVDKFAACVQDSEQLKSTLLEMQTVKQENESLKERLKTTNAKLRKTQTELEDKKVKLAGFEKHFSEKIAEIDNKYALRMQGLMSDNTDLRRHYVKKCEQVFRLQAKHDTEQEESVRNAKETIQAVIMARARSNVSLTALRNEPASVVRAVSGARVGMRRQRRLSAPITVDEVQSALRETSAVEGGVAATRALHVTPADELFQKKPRPHTSHHNWQASPRAEPGRQREPLVPTAVDVSTQAIQNLREQTEFPP